MSSNKLISIWVIFASLVCTGYTCLAAIIKRTTGKINRQWVDAALLSWINNLLRIAQVNCIVKNPDNIKPKPNQATIVMCNHSSLYDIPLSFKAFPAHSIRMLAKKELFKIPIMGQGMLAAEFPCIDRKKRAQAVRDLAAVKKLMESGIVMWIYPEGTRSQDGKLASFKPGTFVAAIEAHAVIIPVAICGAYNVLPARTWQVRMQQTVELRIGRPIAAETYSIANKNQLMQIVHNSIKGLLEGE